MPWIRSEGSLYMARAYLLHGFSLDSLLRRYFPQSRVSLESLGRWAATDNLLCTEYVLSIHT